MVGQPGLFDGEKRLKALSAASDPLQRLAKVVDFEVFREDLERAPRRHLRIATLDQPLRADADARSVGLLGLGT